jgi:tetratricopeptide (TPR) repeat protein
VLLAQRQGRLGPAEVAEAELERGKIQYLLGEHDRAIASLERAIDADPERQSTYADVLTFLIPRGELDEALDAYHRVLGRSSISEYIKIYCSLWVLDLGRRAGQPEDPLVRGFLDGVNGGKWEHELARWATGRESEADLSAHATTPAHRAEAAFYIAMRRLEDGRRDEARALLRKVLDTQMMAFFEFDMASYYLRHLPPHSDGKSPRGATADSSDLF